MFSFAGPYEDYYEIESINHNYFHSLNSFKIIILLEAFEIIILVVKFKFI